MEHQVHIKASFVKLFLTVLANHEISHLMIKLFQMIVELPLINKPSIALFTSIGPGFLFGYRFDILMFYPEVVSHIAVSKKHLGAPRRATLHCFFS